MEMMNQPTIPGLPDDLALRCLARISHGYHESLGLVCKGWRKLLQSSEYSSYKAIEGLCGNWLFVLTEGSENQWIAYDPEADRWRPLPRTPTSYSNQDHFGFSCVCVSNKFLLIGGSYLPPNPTTRQKPLTTNEVFQFDPFTKQWKRVASMMTPRSHFACSVVSGKVYVAGGGNALSDRGIALSEVYDPLADRWDGLPPMPSPRMFCIGESCKGKFHVVGDLVGQLEQKISQVFDPSKKTWQTVDDTRTFPRGHVAFQVLGGGHICTIVDWRRGSTKTWYVENEEWYHLGFVPPVVLPEHSRPLEAFDYGFAILGKEIYVLGGRVLKKEEEAGVGKCSIVRLSTVRVCDRSVLPVQWRETRPMYGPACGSVLGCASMEAGSSLRSK